MTLSITECPYAECDVLLVVMLIVIMPNGVVLSVIMLCVVAPLTDLI
jgi:hypothetical protein